jgi:hypothetical protein
VQKKLTEDEQKSLELDKLIEETQDRADFDTAERDRYMREFVKNGAHAWVQRGIEISCTICPNHHGFYVPPDIILKGVDAEGRAILDKIV